MYTELVCALELDKNTPVVVINAIEFMTGQRDELDTVPDHELFKSARWRFMLRGDSYYFDGDSHSVIRFDQFGTWYVTIRCNLKNYDDEIEKFVDWISLYSETSGFIGYTRYEEDEHPKLLYI
ncbi:hypothetical protein MHI57_24895 [Cytobacillus sp. FSL K6-0129]|uniref:hypothetical protein n=1 Tax=Cytobacillus sp. FSL K6-0129 TaxID=2921421 RepID=UPI0030FA3D9C